MDQFISLFSSTMSVYNNYKDTPSTIIANSKSRYFNKRNILHYSVYNIEPTYKSKYEFPYNKIYEIQSKSDPEKTLRYVIEGFIKFDKATGKTIE